MLAISQGMPVRNFTDSSGIQWRVWSTVPTTSTVLSRDFERGWLTFESTESLRRLAPIPNDWVEAGSTKLELMLRAAREVPRRTGLQAQPQEAEESRESAS